MRLRRKFVAVILVLVNFILICPRVVVADELGEYADTTCNADLKELLVTKSIEAFPEYEEKIRCENVSMEAMLKMRNSGFGNVVYSETRSISDVETVTYTEFDSGIALTAIGLMTGRNVTNEDNYGTHTTTTMNVWLQWGASESILFIKNFKYSIYATSYDKILSKGSIDPLLNTAVTKFEGQQIIETATSKAYVEYSGIFEFNINYGDFQIPMQAGAYLKIEVGNNACELSAR